MSFDSFFGEAGQFNQLEETVPESEENYFDYDMGYERDFDRDYYDRVFNRDYDREYDHYQARRYHDEDDFYYYDDAPGI